MWNMCFSLPLFEITADNIIENVLFAESAFPDATKIQKTRAISETVTAQYPGKSHHSHSNPKDIKKTHIGQGQDTNASDHHDDKLWNHLQPSNDLPDSIFEIIDLTSTVPNDSNRA